ncbi:hypothetical protein M406DRAFT_354037, partial [Cryphonectria parasitica EP155]
HRRHRYPPSHSPEDRRAPRRDPLQASSHPGPDRVAWHPPVLAAEPRRRPQRPLSEASSPHDRHCHPGRHAAGYRGGLGGICTALERGRAVVGYEQDAS